MSPPEAAPGAEGNGNGFALGYGKVQLRARGPLTVLIVLCLGMMAVVVWGVREAATTTHEAIVLMSTEHRLIRDDNRVMACIVSLPTEERDRLRMLPAIQWEMVCPGIMRR